MCFRKSRCLKCKLLTHIFSSVVYYVSGSLLPPKRQRGGIFKGKPKVLVRVPLLLVRVPLLRLRGPAEGKRGGRRSASTVGRRSAPAALVVTRPPDHRLRVSFRAANHRPQHTHTHTPTPFFKEFINQCKPKVNRTGTTDYKQVSGSYKCLNCVVVFILFLFVCLFLCEGFG